MTTARGRHRRGPAIIAVLAVVAACSVERTQAYLIPRDVLDDSVRVLHAELAERFTAARPESLVVHSGRRLRLVYVDTSHRTPSSSSTLYDYAADSTRYRQAFDQAAWLWARFGRRAGVDTISVRFVRRDPADPAAASEEFSFDARQLRHPDSPPLLGRGDRPRLASRDVRPRVAIRDDRGV